LTTGATPLLKHDYVFSIHFACIGSPKTWARLQHFFITSFSKFIVKQLLCFPTSQQLKWTFVLVICSWLVTKLTGKIELKASLKNGVVVVENHRLFVTE
jgi:hypothetical protein